MMIDLLAFFFPNFMIIVSRAPFYFFNERQVIVHIYLR